MLEGVLSMANQSYMEFMHCLLIHHWWILFHLSHKIQMITKTIHQVSSSYPEPIIYVYICCPVLGDEDMCR